MATSKSRKEVDLWSALSIGERLRITRKSMGLTQLSISKALSVTREAYTMYETGAREPPVYIAIELYRVYGWTLDWIYLGDPSNLPLSLHEKILDRLSEARVRVM